MSTQRQNMMHEESPSKATHRLEYRLIGLIINSITEGVVDSIVLAFACTNVLLKRGETIRAPENQLQHCPGIRKQEPVDPTSRYLVYVGAFGPLLGEQESSTVTFMLF